MITEEMRNNANIIKYKVDNFDIIFKDGSIEKMDGDMVTHLYIEKDYDDLYFPIVNISIVMKDAVYQKIQNEIDTVKFRLRVIKNIYDKKNTFLKYELCFNEVFQCFKDKDSIIKDNDAKQSKESTEGEDSVTLGTNTRNFYLFTDEVTKCKKTYNLSISSGTMTDLLVYIIGNAGIGKLLMSKLNNNPSVGGLTVPSGNVVETITYLDNLKSFYKKGMLLFFDIDTAYIIDMNYQCTAWRKNEIKITHVHVANQQSGDSQLNGYFINKDRKQTHVFANTDRVQTKNMNILGNQLSGNNIKIIDSKTGSVSNVGANTTTVGNSNEHLVSIKSSNKYAATELQTRLEENECICGVTLIGVDLEVVSPNKEVVVTYEDTKLNKEYGGSYRVCRSITTLTKDAGELIGEVQVELRKQK